MNKIAEGAVALNLPTVEEPLPGFRGKPGMLRLRQLLKGGVWRTRAALSAQDEAMVREMVEALKLALVPAAPAAIRRLLEALMWHYPTVPRSPEAAASVAADWLRDIGHLPEDIVDAACTGWRRGPNVYAPSPGHLLALAEPILSARRNLLLMAERLVAPPEPVKAAGGSC